MSEVNWKTVWENSLKNKELFPIKLLNKNTLSVSCPTRFSNAGELSIDITPTFNDASIALEMLIFNDNLELTDIVDEKELKDKKIKSTSDFNKLAVKLVEYELKNRIMDRFLIKSNGFKSNKEAENALVDYINNKATESGRMFDDKLDELNDVLENGNKVTAESIRDYRAYILRKIEGVLNTHYNWKSLKNEEFNDSVIECYDDNDNLMAVISLVDNCVLVDIAMGVTAKVSLMQSDEEIEQELVADVDAAKEILADREIEQLKDVVAGNLESEKIDEYEAPVEEDNDEEYLDDLEKRLAHLESLYINRKLKRLY
jgi:hypothetical protein